MTIEQIIDIQSNHRLIFDLPSELPIGKARVKLTVIPEDNKIDVTGKLAFGCLHKYANPAKIQGEKCAWSQAALKKHENN